MQRIVVLRANLLGDLVQTLPALDALRAAFPDAEIVLLGRELHADLLAGRPSPVDRVEVLPALDADDAATRAVLDRLRAEGVDLALQLHGGGRESNPVVRALGAGLTVGARTDDAAPLDRSVRYERWQHEVVRLLTLVELAGAPPVVLQPRLAVTHADQDAAASFVPYRSPVVVLHPGASDRRRRWPVERFAAVGDELARRGASVVVTGSDAESDLAAEVTARMSGPARSVAGRLSLPALVGLLDAAELVVANDTGPRHLAEAIGTPSASVYLASNLITAAPIDRDRHRVQVSWRTSCPLCDERECGHREPWVTDVEVADVLADALALLDLRR